MSHDARSSNLVVIGCTNHGCKVKWPTRIGIGTNGSCPCLREIRDTSLRLTVEKALAARDAEIDRLNALINTPHTHDFLEGVRLEMPHQRERWGSEHDAGKTPADWLWLVAHLTSKALMSLVNGNIEKAKHHVITSAAALGNWFLAITGADTSMRPGIATPPGEAHE